MHTGEPITGSGVKVNGVPYHKEHKPTAEGGGLAPPAAPKAKKTAAAKPKGKAAGPKPSTGAGAKFTARGLAAEYAALE